jgi:subtilisin family serine protease
MIEKMLHKTLIAIGGLMISVSASAGKVPIVEKSQHDSYIVIMKLEPAVNYEGTIPGFAATKPAKTKKINARSANVKKYKNKLQKDHDDLLAAHGLQGKKIHDYSIAINGFSARMSHEQAKSIAFNKKVARVIPDRLYQTTTHNSPTFLGLDGEKGPWSLGITGEGIIIGVIDTGIWPEHASFADDGSYSDLGITLDGSVYASCEFGNTDHRPDDVVFECNNKLLGARQVLTSYRIIYGATANEFDSARDENGHGSHTASTAGGNADVASEILGRDLGLATGIAHRARIIAYKALGVNGGLGSDLAAAIDQAVADGVDVINYSIGSTSFAIGPDDIAFLYAADAGVFVATSNGNSGPGPATTGSPASVPWLTSVGASTQDRTYQGSASSADGWEFFGSSITDGTAELPLVDAAAIGGELCLPGTLDATLAAGKIVLCQRGLIARADKSLAVSIAGGAGTILYNSDDGQALITDTHHVPTVHINNTDGLLIKEYITTTDNPTAQITAGVFTEIDAPWMAAFSSRGPNRLSDDIIKPDITAPGVNILAANTPIHRGELFQMISGTSMSSPHVAGLFALIKQVRPDWTPAMAKSAMMTTAHQEVKKEDGVTQADAFDRGAGHVMPGGYPKRKGSMFNPSLVYDAGYLEYLGFMCGAELGLVSPDECDYLDSIGIPLDPSDLNIPSIAVADLTGTQTMHRTVIRTTNMSIPAAKSSSTKKYYVSVDAPEGFDVSVEPTELELLPGESAGYAVTITNVSAPGNEWRHGSLTWSNIKAHNNKKRKMNKQRKGGGEYIPERVYSPIAVKAVLLGTPDYVSGSGESGSAEFDINFGYNGSYTAAAHGLVPSVSIMDTVPQDPDQTFDPNDGYSKPHSMVVSSAAILRFAIPPEATVPNADLDIYLENPAGEIVAQSGNGGTDEMIEIAQPADGEWVLWVHGWAAPANPTPYTLYSWIISNTPGGNLNIDNAPTTANVGVTETVGVSWTDAAAGQWHYGLVSHSDGSGVISSTLVEVDNR